MIEVSKFVNNYVVTQNFWHLHKTDIERNCTSRGTTAPTSSGVAEATAFVMITVEFGEIF